ncbi:MAG: serine hydrolase [Acidobacteriota bacterium]
MRGLVTAALLFLLPHLVHAQARPDSSAVDRIVNDAMKAWHVPGVAVAIVQNDRVVYVKGYGVRESGATLPVTPDTLFPIASTTKAFTTTAMAMLIDEKNMQWDDPVRKHLEYFHMADPCADSMVTLRDIVSHRTGFSRHDELWDGTTWSSEDVLRHAGDLKLSAPFRTTYQYQNIMFIAAGRAVAAASKMSWADFVRTRIFEPLGMTHTRIGLADYNASEHASGHSFDPKTGTIKTIPVAEDVNIEGAGAIKSSARDLGQWLRLQLSDGTFDGKRLVSAEALAETHTPQTVIRVEGATKETNPETSLEAYGLGWVIQDYRGELLVSHAGALHSSRTQVDLLPKIHSGFVVLSNLNRSLAVTSMRNSLADLLLGRPSPRDWNAYYLALDKKSDAKDAQTKLEREAKRKRDTKPSRELSAYAGTYESNAYGTAIIAASDLGLTLRWGRLAIPLRHFHFDTFDAVDEGSDIDEQTTFRLDANGEVKTMTLFGEEFVKK